MDFATLNDWVGAEPLFETGLLLAGKTDPLLARKQLSRWVSGGKVIQLRRGLYMLAPPYQKVRPHPFLVANRIHAPSYVSLQSALSYYDLIPEHVPLTTSVTTARPARFQTPAGGFEFRHVQRSWFHGFRRVDLGGGQAAFIALPEKALLDLIYLIPGGDSPAYLRGLRLQNLESLDMPRLQKLAADSGQPKLERALAAVRTIRDEEKSAFEAL